METRLSYHRKLVTVSNLPATRFGDTVTLPMQICGWEQISSDEIWGHDYVTVAICGWEQLSSDEIWGHDYVTIASLWLRATYHWGHDSVIIASLWL
eukprot:s2112_g6.t1